MGRIWAGWVLLLFATLLAVACGVSRVDGQRGANAGAGAGGESSGSGRLVEEIRQTNIDKLDLLMVVDNSISMADKQELLAKAMPALVARLVTPRCMRDCTAADCSLSERANGVPTLADADASGRCPEGRPELPPLKDLHVGVITSSLGSHGANGQNDVCTLPQDDDHAHLLGELRGLSGTYNELGVLGLDPLGKLTPQGDTDPSKFVQKFSDMIQAAGEHGCGYESTLEAWYRFLIDPEPPLSVVLNGTTASVQGVDSALLLQRQAFLRPDSVVVIVMLTDENDCSIQDGGFGWTVSSVKPMFRSTSECFANPNDACCQSCADSVPNRGCPALTSDTECLKGQTLASATDDLNLRCWQQKRRFGFDLLYPTTRYSEGLLRPSVQRRSDGMLVLNPLYAGAPGDAPRDQGLVFLEGIVGVPWQDLADDASLQGTGLRYLAEYELESADRWKVILGEPNQGTTDPPQPPTDPFMLETPEDRTSLAGSMLNPITHDGLVPASSANPRGNAINGHEQVNLGATDLQYACTFPLAKPRVCDRSLDVGCDCDEQDLAFNRPLCQPPQGGPAATTQYYAKAYPGLRLLKVLKEFKDNAIVASTCPKVIDETSPAYGYNPAIDALIERVRHVFTPRCLARALPVDDTGRVPCVVMEALTDQPSSCDCAALGRVSLTSRPELTKAAQQRLATDGACGGTAGAACDSICVCELPQLSGQDLQVCQQAVTPPATPGFCYVDAAPNEVNVGNPELVQNCADDAKHLLRFVGGAPTPHATLLLQCAY